MRLGTLESAPDGPINLGNEREVTIAHITDLVLVMTGSSSGAERLPLPQDDPVRRRPDTTRAREVLGWEATVPLELGLPSTIEYFRAVLSITSGPCHRATCRVKRSFRLNVTLKTWRHVSPLGSPHAYRSGDPLRHNHFGRHDRARDRNSR